MPRRGPWIAGLVFLVLVPLVGGGVALWLSSPLVDRELSQAEEAQVDEVVADILGTTAGDRPDGLRAACEAGHWESCDRLYSIATPGSQDQAFGDSCGDRNEPAGWCADLYGDGRAATPPDSVGSPSGTPTTELDRLSGLCADGHMVSCDDLFLRAPQGSTYESFGESCGNRREPDGGFCMSSPAEFAEGLEILTEVFARTWMDMSPQERLNFCAEIRDFGINHVYDTVIVPGYAHDDALPMPPRVFFAEFVGSRC